MDSHIAIPLNSVLLRVLMDFIQSLCCLPSPDSSCTLRCYSTFWSTAQSDRRRSRACGMEPSTRAFFGSEREWRVCSIWLRLPSVVASPACTGLKNDTEVLVMAYSCLILCGLGNKIETTYNKTVTRCSYAFVHWKEANSPSTTEMTRFPTPSDTHRPRRQLSPPGDHPRDDNN